MLYILVADRWRAKLYETPRLDEGTRPRLLLDQIDFLRAGSSAKAFVDDLCGTLRRAQREGCFTRLLLAAPRDVLGPLRAALDPCCQALLSTVVEENLLGCPPDEVARRFLQATCD